MQCCGLLGGAVLTVRCGGSAPDLEQIERQKAAYDPTLDCSSTIGLFPAEKLLREQNKYTDRSPQQAQFCFNCDNFEPAKRPGTCASCRTVKGPIQPLGWCTAWVEKRS